MSTSTSASSIAATELPELVTLTFEHRPKRYPEEECVDWDDLAMERRPDSWGVYEFYPWGIPYPNLQQRFKEYGMYGNPAEAWVQMQKHYDHFNSLIFVGPGESPAVLASPKFESEYWTVYRVDDQGQCIETGRFVHRLSVLSAVKSIIADGGCPVAVSPYLAPDFEWDVDRVVMSSEQESPEPQGQSLNHQSETASNAEQLRVVIRHAKDDFCQTAMVTDRGRPFAEQWVAEQQFEDGSEVWVVTSEEQFPYNAPYTAETVGYFQTEIGDDLEHLLSIAKRGKSRGASGGERQARRIVKRLLDDVAGLDDSALNGIVELAELLRSDDGSDAEFVREAIK